jgi:hypothetical protein
MTFSRQTLVFEALNRAVENLNWQLVHAGKIAHLVAEASRQIKSSSQVAARSASDQSSALGEISDSLQSILSMIRRNAENAQDAQKLTDQTRDSAGLVVESVGRLSEAINKIKASWEGWPRPGSGYQETIQDGHALLRALAQGIIHPLEFFPGPEELIGQRESRQDRGLEGVDGPGGVGCYMHPLVQKPAQLLQPLGVPARAQGILTIVNPDMNYFEFRFAHR